MLYSNVTCTKTQLKLRRIKTLKTNIFSFQYIYWVQFCDENKSRRWVEGRNGNYEELEVGRNQRGENKFVLVCEGHVH